MELVLQLRHGVLRADTFAARIAEDVRIPVRAEAHATEHLPTHALVELVDEVEDGAEPSQAEVDANLALVAGVNPGDGDRKSRHHVDRVERDSLAWRGVRPQAHPAAILELQSDALVLVGVRVEPRLEEPEDEIRTLPKRQCREVFPLVRCDRHWWPP